MNFVTGGTGFVGAHVVRALIERGERVRCLVRGASSRSNLEGLPVEIVTGDLTDLDSLREAMRGVRRVYHCAADYRLYAADPTELYETNVEGTRNVLRSAQEVAAEKVVYTSSVGALAVSRNSTPQDEQSPVELADVTGHYKRSKFLAERVAEEWAANGLPVVIVNPSTPIGELDVKPTPTGKIIVDFLKRKMLATVDTGLNLVDVRDVAEGHLLAAERGKVGQKYILGNQNLTLRDMFVLLSSITGIPAPRLNLPHWIPLTYARVNTAYARLRGRTPSVPIEGVKMSRYKMFFNCEKAVAELGVSQTPIEYALQRAVDWFQENGYLQ